jgi:hypothetical protein
MAALQPIEYTQYSYGVFEKKHYMECTTPTRPTGTSIDLSAWDALAGDPDQLIAALNKLLLHGTMSEAMRHIVRDAVTGIPDDKRRLRAQTAIGLIATSPQYQVQQ